MANHSMEIPVRIRLIYPLLHANDKITRAQEQTFCVWGKYFGNVKTESLHKFQLKKDAYITENMFMTHI
jgi:hypothetical protein